MSQTMKAAVIRVAGGPEMLKVEHLPIPVPVPGHVLIRVHAAGINRSEMFTRQGHSPGVTFPRVLGIEACGVVAKCPGGEFHEGDRVITAMGGMGRMFDGGYAEYTCPPVRHVVKVNTSLPWHILGALPEMLQTAWGSLFKSLDCKNNETLLIRGGTTSVGLAAAAIAKAHGMRVVSTSRSDNKKDLLLQSGADHVIIDSGTIAGDLRKLYPNGVDKVLELIGTVSLKDSLNCCRERGVVCMTGIVGNKWTLDSMSPMEFIPTAVCLTSYSGGVEEFVSTPFNPLLKQIEEGKLKVQVGRVYKLDEIVEAHRTMEENTAGGKIVLLCE